MWHKLLGSILAVAAASGTVVNASPVEPGTPCRIVDGDRLPAETGGPAAVCAAIDRAISARFPGVRYSAEVRVLSKSALAVMLDVGGRTVPEQRLSVIDRNLNAGSIERFAQALAAQAAKAGHS